MSLAGAGESQIGCVPALQSECGVGLPSDGWPPQMLFRWRHSIELFRPQDGCGLQSVDGQGTIGIFTCDETRLSCVPRQHWGKIKLTRDKTHTTVRIPVPVALCLHARPFRWVGCKKVKKEEG